MSLVSDYIPVSGGGNYSIKDNANYVNNIKMAEYDSSKKLVIRQIDKFNSATHIATLNTLKATTAYIIVAVEMSSGTINLDAGNDIVIIKQ